MVFLAFHDFKVVVKFQMMFADEFLKFIYSEKATKFCEIFTLLLMDRTLSSNAKFESSNLGLILGTQITPRLNFSKKKPSSAIYELHFELKVLL